MKYVSHFSFGYSYWGVDMVVVFCLLHIMSMFVMDDWNLVLAFGEFP